MEYSLRVGERAVVRRNIFATTWTVIYAGMPSQDRYSIVLSWAAGYQASSCNLYLTESMREVRFKAGRLYILDRSPEHIRFRYERP